MKNSEIFKYHLSKRLPAVLVTVFLVAAFGLYYVGFYDISFIERPDSWKGNLDAFVSILTKSYKEKPVDTTEDIPPIDNTETPETNPPSQSSPTKPQRPGGQSQAVIYSFQTVSEMAAAGYVRSDGVWNSNYAMAILDIPYALPTKFTYSRRVRETEKFITYDDGRETERTLVKSDTPRPALEMYMGYIIYDDNGTLNLIGPDGTVLTKYNDKEYIPAYTRDKEGRPLFYKRYKYDLEYPTLLDVPDEEGNTPWLETKKLEVESHKFYYLSENGHKFEESDYNDATDSRGLYFDYPAYYGNGDSDQKRYCLNGTKVFTNLDGVTSLIPDTYWCYSKDELDLTTLLFDKDGKNLAEEGGPDKLTMFPFTKAFNYYEDHATVVRDVKWDYYHEEVDEFGYKYDKYYEVTSSEVRVVDKNGENTFESRKNYYSDLGWTANERFVEPLSKSIASIGSYYFDHGYMRLRVQSYDRYYFTDLNSIFIVSDEDILVDHNGNQLPLPSGYKLIGYSDGIITLEKDGKYGYMNTQGNWIFEPGLTEASPFLEGIAVCKNSEGSYGAISTDGTVILPFRYDYLTNASSGSVLAFSEDIGWTVYQKMVPNW